MACQKHETAMAYDTLLPDYMSLNVSEQKVRQKRAKNSQPCKSIRLSAPRPPLPGSTKTLKTCKKHTAREDKIKGTTLSSVPKVNFWNTDLSRANVNMCTKNREKLYAVMRDLKRRLRCKIKVKNLGKRPGGSGSFRILQKNTFFT